MMKNQKMKKFGFTRKILDDFQDLFVFRNVPLSEGK